MKAKESHFWEPRKCFIPPPKEADLAADLLFKAVEAYNIYDYDEAKRLIVQADLETLEKWRYKISGPYNQETHRMREIINTLPFVEKDDRPKPRMPNAETQKKLIERDGYRCQYCNIQLIAPNVFQTLRTLFPNEARWGRTNIDKHPALNIFWLTFEHVIPHSRGGTNELENCIVSCQTCNCGKGESILEELGLIDPRTHHYNKTDWNGLTHLKA